MTCKLGCGVMFHCICPQQRFSPSFRSNGLNPFLFSFGVSLMEYYCRAFHEWMTRGRLLDLLMLPQSSWDGGRHSVESQSNERQLSPLCSQEKLGCLEIIYIKSTLWMSVSLVYREKTPTYRSMQKKDFKTTKKRLFFNVVPFYDTVYLPRKGQVRAVFFLTVLFLL